METLEQILGKLRSALCAVLVLAATSASALEVAPGDYEAYPAGATIAVQYLQFAQTGKLYRNGRQVADDFELRPTVGIFRLLHVVKLSENAFVDPQFLLPFGRVEGHGTADTLGLRSASVAENHRRETRVAYQARMNCWICPSSRSASA